jgi:Protein of unknown function (DUF3775)
VRWYAGIEPAGRFAVACDAFPCRVRSDTPDDEKGDMHSEADMNAKSRSKVPLRREVPTPALSISPEKVSYIIAKAREFDVKDVVTDPDSSSNASDDAMLSVLEDHKDDPVVAELRAAIFALNVDEQIDLVTLAWLGRGDGGVEDWDDLRAEAARAHNRRTASYLLGIPLLSDYLEEGLSELGIAYDEGSVT